MQDPKTPSGFTLVELTVVLVIIGLLLGGLLLPLSAQQDIKNVAAAEKQLAEIKEALIGYAVIKGNFPCPMPTTITDPGNAGYGVAGADCSIEGILPWKTLGVSEVDPWGQKRSVSTDDFRGYWRYRLHANFASPNIIKPDTAIDPTDVTQIKVYRTGTAVLQHTTDELPILVVFSTGRDLTANGRNGAVDLEYDASDPSQTFDDLLIWLSRPALFSRLAAAGKF